MYSSWSCFHQTFVCDSGRNQQRGVACRVACGRLAQLEERLVCNQKAGGSNPPASTPTTIVERCGRFATPFASVGPSVHLNCFYKVDRCRYGTVLDSDCLVSLLHFTRNDKILPLMTEAYGRLRIVRIPHFSECCLCI